MQPTTTTTTTTTTEMWQWQCGTCRADWKMLRQVTTCWCSPHGDDGGRCCHGALPPPSRSAGNPAPHCHNNHHRHEEGGTSSRALAAGAEGSSNADAGRHTAITTLNRPAPPPVVAELCWVPDPYLMVQQLREFESLNDDELVALRVQLQEYAEEIHKSTRDTTNAGTGMNMNWLLALPPNVRDVVILARDVIESFIAISTTTRSAPPAN